VIAGSYENGMTPACPKCLELSKSRGEGTKSLRAGDVFGLIPDVVLYNDNRADLSNINQAVQVDVRKVDCLLVIGTSLSTNSSRNLFKDFSKHAKSVFVVNKYQSKFLTNWYITANTKETRNQTCHLFENDCDTIFQYYL
jgi:NAD-dependent SIR2 family protein deacetylase